MKIVGGPETLGPPSTNFLTDIDGDLLDHRAVGSTEAKTTDPKPLIKPGYDNTFGIHRRKDG